MNQLAGYWVKELIYEGARTLVYRGVDRQTQEVARQGLDSDSDVEEAERQKPVILKKLRKEYPTFNELLEFRHQYVITKNLDLPGIVKPHALEKDGNGYVLVMEDVGGISLSQYYRERSLSCEDFFPVALSLTKILGELYRHRVIHKDIKPSNILINPESKEIFLIDFSIASLLPRETQTLQSVGQLEGTLAYISPEQTGRMNRGIDYRSDFYSLGVTFYEMLAGQLPFESNDAMELVHCHIAKMPKALGTRAEAKGNRAEEIPGVLSDIVLKLMAKTPEERYQSAKGLERDLTECWQQWQKTGKVSHFELGRKDRSDRFIIPEKLYGRETEVKTLLSAFDRVAAGNTEMMMVAGFSGIGKTAVVNEVHKPIVEKRGYFIKGKFDQFQRNIPFSAFVIAFRDLIGQLLAESDDGADRWKTNILNALGENGQVIIEVIPELELLIGKQPPGSELSGSAAQNRFNLLFQKFIQVFTTADHPLVIFVDDLQWADSASLKLMQLLTESEGSGYLLLVGAYRDNVARQGLDSGSDVEEAERQKNKVFPTHPLMLTLDEIAKSGAILNTITLAPLSHKELNRLVADALSCETKLALPLTELVYQKTKGNPFFATQFLKGLHQDGWIAFNFDLGYWECDMTGVRSLALTEDVVEFMATRLHQLPESTREMLKLAACIGNQFELATLAMASDRPVLEVGNAIWRALQEGLILPLSETYKFYQQENIDSQFLPDNSQFPNYKFLHDRVQQAAYSLIPEEEKQAIQYRIAKRLLSELSLEEREERIFDLVDRINIGRSLIEDESEKKQLIELNLSAARKAKASTAYEASKTYLKMAISLLENNPWTASYSLAFQLHLNLAETELMSADFESFEKTVATLLEEAKSPLERAKIYVLKVNQYSLQGPYSEAIKVGLAGLGELGIVVNRDTLAETVREDYIAIEETLKNRPIASLLDLPVATNPETKVAIELLMNLLSAAYISSDIDLYGFTVVRNLRLSMEYGNIPKSITGYVNYGEWLGLMKSEYQRGLEFADLALQLSYKLNSKSQQSSSCFLLGGCIHVKAKPIQGAAEINYEGFLAGMDSGELQYAGYNLFANIYNRLFQGENLAAIATDIDKFSAIALKIQNDLASSVLTACRFFINKLSGTADAEPNTLSAEERAWLERHEASGSYLPLGIYYILQMHKACLERNCALGVGYEMEARKFLTACASCTIAINYYYYGSLNLWGQYLSLTEAEREKALQQIEANQRQLKIVSESCPENFLHKYLLVEAERSRIEGKILEAMELYDRAIAEAKENGYIQEEAIANELAAKFYLNCGREKIARTYMTDAYYCYARWDAKAKVADLEKRYPQLLAPILQSPKTELATSLTISQSVLETLTSTSSGTNILLDFSSAFKASLAISGEIELERLLWKLMELVMENAGATKSALLLPKEDSLVIEAMASYSEEGAIVSLGNSLPVESNSELPQTILNTVKRTREALVINDLSKQARFASDLYLVRTQPKSILCLPLLDRGQLRGILYLENRVTSGAFSSDRLELLKVIVAQAAISLQNARLYQDLETANQQLESYNQTLEQKVAARTIELNEKNQNLEAAFKELKQTQAQLIQTEKMSSLGRMVGGVAHEINNPTSFIFGNLHHAKDYVRDLLDLIEVYREDFPDAGDRVTDKLEEIELDYLKDDLEKLFASMKNGCERIRSIVQGLRTFSRLDEAQTKSIDIHSSIDSTIMLLQNQLRNASNGSIEVIKEYGNLPQVTCYASQLNQVFFHILSNGIDAFSKLEKSSVKPTITIGTEVVDKQTVKIIIGDNGEGMSADTLAKIFDPFFTTKPVGKGTGLGMAIAYQIIVGEHGGNLTYSSELGKGTDAVITLPVTPLKSAIH